LFVSLSKSSKRLRHGQGQERRRQQEGQEGQVLSTYVEARLGLIDTGSIARSMNRGNTMSKTFYDRMLMLAPESLGPVCNCKLTDSDIVCSTLSGVCSKPHACVFAYVEFFNEISLDFNRVKLEFLVLDQLHDIIVGNNAIKENSLLRVCPRYIENQGFVPPDVQASASLQLMSCCTTCEAAPRGATCVAIHCARKSPHRGQSDGPSRAPKAPRPLPEGLRAVPAGETTTVLPENATRYRVVTSSSGHFELAQIYEKEELLTMSQTMTTSPTVQLLGRKSHWVETQIMSFRITQLMLDMLACSKRFSS
jgi:hypothetical protein